MIHTIFTIQDAKAKAFLPPFTLPELGMAVRTFTDCVNNPEHAFGAHPQDYTLFTLGKFDDSTAQYKLEQSPLVVHNGLELLNPEVIQNEEQEPTITPV